MCFVVLPENPNLPTELAAFAWGLDVLPAQQRPPLLKVLVSMATISGVDNVTQHF